MPESAESQLLEIVERLRGDVQYLVDLRYLARGGSVRVNAKSIEVLYGNLKATYELMGRVAGRQGASEESPRDNLAGNDDFFRMIAQRIRQGSDRAGRELRMQAEQAAARMSADKVRPTTEPEGVS